MFCISRKVVSPATLGFLEPVVLLPESFLSLDKDAQRSVACHELTHVRRKDWLVTVMEEVAGSLFWFHPAIRFLLGKAKLTREQVVDAEVVRMNAPGPYIEALLSMAVVSKPRLAIPAAPFFTEGHLAHRLRSLLASPGRSLTRLLISCTCMAFLLALAGWSVLILFPLNGEAHVVTPTVQGAVTDQVGSSGSRLFLLPLVPQTFNLKLPPPGGATWGDVAYFVNVEVTDSRGEQDVLLTPPPPPPPPGSPGLPVQMFALRAKALRPGQHATPEEIQSFIASFPEQSLVEVTQGEDGTVQRVMVTRRRADATTPIPAGTRIFYGLAGTAPAANTDGIH